LYLISKNKQNQCLLATIISSLIYFNLLFNCNLGLGLLKPSLYKLNNKN